MQASICFIINHFYKYLPSTFMFSNPLFYLSFYEWPKAFLKELNKLKFFQCSFFIKFLDNRLEMFKVIGSVLFFFILKRGVLLDSTPDCINKYFSIAKILLEKSLELILRQEFYLALIFVLVLAQTYPFMKKKSGK